MHFIIDNFIVDKVSSLTSARGSLATVLITASLDAAGMGLVMPILPALLHEAGVTADAVPLNVGVLIALYAGTRIFSRLSTRVFRYAAMALLGVMAANLLIT